MESSLQGKPKVARISKALGGALAGTARRGRVSSAGKQHGSSFKRSVTSR